MLAPRSDDGFRAIFSSINLCGIKGVRCLTFFRMIVVVVRW